MRQNVPDSEASEATRQSFPEVKPLRAARSEIVQSVSMGDIDDLEEVSNAKRSFSSSKHKSAPIKSHIDPLHASNLQYHVNVSTSSSSKKYLRSRISLSRKSGSNPNVAAGGTAQMDNSEELSVNLSNAMHAGNLFVEFLATSKGSVIFGFRIFLPSVTNLEGDKSKWFAWTRGRSGASRLSFRVVESKRPFPKPLHIADCLDSESVRMYFQSQRGNWLS